MVGIIRTVVIMLQSPELKLGEEFDKLLYTDEDCSPIVIPFLFKKYRRDSQNSKIGCKACNEGRNGNIEGSLDCPYCLGAGYEWDQGISQGWFSKPEFSIERTLVASVADRQAESAFNKIYLYTDKTIVFEDTDVILVPKLDTNNKIQTPVVAEGIFLVFDDFNFRSNQSQAEYNRYRLSTTFDTCFKRLMK